MPNLKDIRNRITSVGSTMQITSAMKLVSAAKLKKATDNIIQLRPYADKLRELLQNVINSTLEVEAAGSLAEKREVNKVLLVVLNSNRGLCGGYNSSIIKKVNSLLAGELAGKEVQLLTIGKKANDAYKKTQTIYKNASDFWSNINFDEVSQIAEDLINKFENKDFDQIRIIYNKFQNAAVQIVQDEQFLPVVIEKSQENTKQVELDYIFNPSKEEILIDLIPQTLKTQLFKTILDANASEHGARMTAMHKATDNASELQKDLKIQYNKARQAAITNEILEIVGGAEALSS